MENRCSRPRGDNLNLSYGRPTEERLETVGTSVEKQGSFYQEWIFVRGCHQELGTTIGEGWTGEPETKIPGRSWVEPICVFNVVEKPLSSRTKIRRRISCGLNNGLQQINIFISYSLKILIRY